MKRKCEKTIKSNCKKTFGHTNVKPPPVTPKGLEFFDMAPTLRSTYSHHFAFLEAEST